MHIKTRVSVVTVGMLTAVLVGVPVLAVGPNSRGNVQALTDRQSTALGTQATDRKEAAQTRLADAKLKACQNRERVINNIMARIADRGSKQLGVFDKITERTEAFYTSKGKALSNYDALVADVNAKRATAQSAVDALKASSVTFKCDGTNPKGAVQSFKDNLKTEIKALKDYKVAIKNLIVGVKSVQGTTSSSQSSQGGR